MVVLNQVILDPDDPTKAFIGSASEPVFGMDIGEATLINVHDASKCGGNPCVVHNPSQHHMRGWALHWRGDRKLMERQCPHGYGHPDPDDVLYQRSTGWAGVAGHGCDGCCWPHTKEER